jgi:hypothetical protein
MTTDTSDILTETGHIIGATYRSTYWRKEYQVFSTADVLGGTDNGVQVLWEDGEVTSHCTPVGDDPMVKAPQYG